jgi:hypothetical protein
MKKDILHAKMNFIKLINYLVPQRQHNIGTTPQGKKLKIFLPPNFTHPPCRLA